MSSGLYNLSSLNLLHHGSESLQERKNKYGSYVKIGFFDSGIGGFSILKHMRKELPSAEVFYIADDSFAPYGEKSDEQIKERCFEMVSELVKKDVELVVVACNTATAISIEDLREKFDVPFIGAEPYINILNDKNWNEKNKGCVITTVLTGKSRRFNKLKNTIDPHRRLDYFCSPRLAIIIEKYFYLKNELILKEEIKRELSKLIDLSYTHYILGCTHYPLVAKIIEEVCEVKCISPCLAIVQRIKDVVGGLEGQSFKTDFQFLSTANSNKSWLKMKNSELKIIHT